MGRAERPNSGSCIASLLTVSLHRPPLCVFQGPHPPSPSMPRSPGYPGRRRKEGPSPSMMFPCVPCGRDVELGEKGLTDCLRNLTLERIVERFGPLRTNEELYRFRICSAVKKPKPYWHLVWWVAWSPLPVAKRQKIPPL